MTSVDLLVHSPQGSPPWVMAKAFAAAVAQSGADARAWRLVDCGSEPGVAAMHELVRRKGDANCVSTCTPVFVQAPLLGKVDTTHRILTPLARLVADRYLLVVRNDSPYGGARDLLQAIRSRSMRSGGYFAGGINHLLALAIAEAAGGAVEFVKVASEADLFPALLDGRIDWAVATPVEIRTRAPAGSLRVLAAIAAAPVPAFPDAPTLASCGASVDFSLWRGLIGPGGLSPAHLAAWRRIVSAAIATPTWRRYLAENGQTASHMAAKPFARFLDSEWGWYQRQMGRAGVLAQPSTQRGTNMAWRRIYSGSGGEQRVGYCRAIVLPDPGGDWVIVSGTTGFDYAAGTISPDPVEQCEQALRNIAEAMAEAGADWSHVFLYRVYVLDAATWDAVVPVIARVIGPQKPATTAVIAPAMDAKIKVEIEVEARLSPRAARAAPAVRRASRASATRKAKAKAQPARKRGRR